MLCPLLEARGARDSGYTLCTTDTFQLFQATRCEDSAEEPSAVTRRDVE